VRTGLAVTLVSFSAMAFFFSIIGVFGILPALGGLSLFAAVACVLAMGPRRLTDTLV